SQLLHHGHDELRHRLSGLLSIPAVATEEILVAGFCALDSGEEELLRAAAAALAGGSTSDRQRGAAIAAWLAAGERRDRIIDGYAGRFLTAEGEIRKTLITREAARSAGCDACGILAA